MNFEFCAEGELYMICQGAGGGYGDVLDRAPEMVIKDVEEGLLSPELAVKMYKVAFNQDNLVLDLEETKNLRNKERQARIDRGIPYDEFVKSWVKDTPPEGLPYMGSWGDDDSVIYANAPGVPGRTIKAGSEGMMLANPKDLYISSLEKQIADLQQKAGSN
jgi:hypothetical protein